MNNKIPFGTSKLSVKPEWIDHNGHMNVAYYLVAFDEAIGDLFSFLGLDRRYRKTHNIATYCGDFHIRYVRELHEHASLKIQSQLIACDEKRIHLCQSMFHASDGYLAAQSEVIYLHINLNNKKVGPMDKPLFNRVRAMCEEHSSLPAPDNLGRRIGWA